MEELLALVARQATDISLWTAPLTAGEESLQTALRELHEAVELMAGIDDGLGG